MKVLIPGHKYQLDSFEGSMEPQELWFIRKEPVEPFGSNGGDEVGTMKTINDGTTNEEVLKMLIDRMKFLQDKFPCRENAIVITKLEESLMWLEKRTADRKARGVEVKRLK